MTKLCRRGTHHLGFSCWDPRTKPARKKPQINLTYLPGELVLFDTEMRKDSFCVDINTNAFWSRVQKLHRFLRRAHWTLGSMKTGATSALVIVL